MIRTTLKALVVAALAMTLTIVTAGNASAETVHDRHDAPWPIDTRQMKVQRFYEGRWLLVTLYSPTYNLGPRLNGLTVTVDSRGRRPRRLQAALGLRP